MQLITSASNLLKAHGLKEFVVVENYLQDLGTETLQPSAGAMVILRQKRLNEEEEDLQVAIHVILIII